MLESSLRLLRLMMPECTFFTVEYVPENISFIIDYFDTITEHVVSAEDLDKPMLVLFHDPTSKYSSRFVNISNSNVVLISLTELSRISQLLEVVIWGFIDQDSSLSFFLGNLSEYNSDYGEAAFQLEGKSILLRIEEQKAKSQEYKDKVSSNELSQLLSIIDGFDRILEFHLIYVIVHELYHYYKDENDKILFDNLSQLVDESNDPYTSYFQKQIELFYKKRTKLNDNIREEIYCDFRAFQVAGKVSTLFDDYDDLLMLIFAPAFYNSLMFREEMIGINSFEDIFFRKAFMSMLVKLNIDLYSDTNQNAFHNIQLTEYFDICYFGILESRLEDDVREHGLIDLLYAQYPAIKELDSVGKISWGRNFGYSNIFKRL